MEQISYQLVAKLIYDKFKFMVSRNDLDLFLDNRKPYFLFDDFLELILDDHYELLEFEDDSEKEQFFDALISHGSEDGVIKKVYVYDGIMYEDSFIIPSKYKHNNVELAFIFDFSEDVFLTDLFAG